MSGVKIACFRHRVVLSISDHGTALRSSSIRRQKNSSGLTAELQLLGVRNPSRRVSATGFRTTGRAGAVADPVGPAARRPCHSQRRGRPAALPAAGNEVPALGAAQPTCLPVGRTYSWIIDPGVAPPRSRRGRAGHPSAASVGPSTASPPRARRRSRRSPGTRSSPRPRQEWNSHPVDHRPDRQDASDEYHEHDQVVLQTLRVLAVRPPAACTRLPRNRP